LQVSAFQDDVISDIQILSSGGLDGHPQAGEISQCDIASIFAIDSDGFVQFEGIALAVRAFEFPKNSAADMHPRLPKFGAEKIIRDVLRSTL
jgi:hypothetical protein